jgi:SAUR family protein
MVTMVWRKRSDGGEQSSPSRGAADEEEMVPRGHIPMVAGDERVLVPVRLLSDPTIAELLDMAAQQYGYAQPGVLRVPCDAGHFRLVVQGAMHR